MSSTIKKSELYSHKNFKKISIPISVDISDNPRKVTCSKQDSDNSGTDMCL